MNRFVTLLAVVVIAAPLLAEEKKPAEQPKPKTQPAASQPAPVPAATTDSPMVAAAKATKKSGKKIIVITNDTLTKEGSGNAHITTTKNMRDIVVPPENPVLEQARKAQAQDRADKERFANEKAKKAKETAAAEQKIGAVAAQQESEGPYGDDPARNEKILEDMAKQKQEQQQPQRTVQELPQDKPEKPPMN